MWVCIARAAASGSRRRSAATTASCPAIDRSGRPFCFSVRARESTSRSFKAPMIRITARLRVARKRALAVAAFDQADGLEHPHRVADRAAAHAEAGGEHALAGQRPAGAEGAVENQHADAVGDFLGHPGFLDRLQQAGRAVGRLPPRRGAALDRPGGGCQTFRLNGSYHWASLAQGACSLPALGFRLWALGRSKRLPVAAIVTRRKPNA